jgi:NIPSNAP.
MIVEMRTYTIKRGHRAAILEALKGPTFAELKRIGVRCAGPWASTEDEQKIFWMRGFPDAAARTKMTNEFYGGAAWTNTLGPTFMPVLEKYDVVPVEMDEAAVTWVV